MFLSIWKNVGVFEEFRWRYWDKNNKKKCAMFHMNYWDECRIINYIVMAWTFGLAGGTWSQGQLVTCHCDILWQTLWHSLTSCDNLWQQFYHLGLEWNTLRSFFTLSSVFTISSCSESSYHILDDKSLRIPSPWWNNHYDQLPTPGTFMTSFQNYISSNL